MLLSRGHNGSCTSRMALARALVGSTFRVDEAILGLAPALVALASDGQTNSHSVLLSNASTLTLHAASWQS